MKSLLCFPILLQVFLLCMLLGRTLCAYADAGPQRGGNDDLHPTPPTNPRMDYSDVIAHLRLDLPKQLAAVGVPGAAIALVDDQQVVWAGGFGFADNERKT